MISLLLTSVKTAHEFFDADAMTNNRCEQVRNRNEKRAKDA